MSSRILLTGAIDDAHAPIPLWLGRAGFTCAADGDAGALLTAARRQADVVLVCAGAERARTTRLVDRLVEDARGPAVVVVSAPDFALALQMQELGAVDCLPWPSSAESVVEAVTRAARLRAGGWRRPVHRSAVEHLAAECQRLQRLVAGCDAEAAEATLWALLDARRPEVAAHSLRVAQTVQTIARALGFDVTRTLGLRRAALLHDVGKAAVPAALLDQAEPLSADDWIVLRGHVTAGDAILAAVPGLSAIAAIVGATHERMDGSGYPAGARGHDIPLESRIIAVADVYDALTSARSYRDAVSHEDANAELARAAGAGLDSDVVHAWRRTTEAPSCC